ncbi:PadR family transcriptional regulator [Seinonella peptonophila]|nr:PadR family transcriptional regulator [Seinonella peptonophila]
MGGNLHGYLLHTILNQVVGPLRKISWGVLYPLIRRLEDEGLIEQVLDEQTHKGRGKKRKPYRITQTGKHQFYLLMEEPIAYTADYDLHFQIKLSNFCNVKDDVKLIILHQYKDHLCFIRRHIEDNRAQIVHFNQIPDVEKPHILNVLDLRSKQVEVNERWIEEKIQEVKKALSVDNH